MCVVIPGQPNRACREYVDTFLTWGLLPERRGAWYSRGPCFVEGSHVCVSLIVIYEWAQWMNRNNSNALIPSHCSGLCMRLERTCHSQVLAWHPYYLLVWQMRNVSWDCIIRALSAPTLDCATCVSSITEQGHGTDHSRSSIIPYVSSRLISRAHSEGLFACNALGTACLMSMWMSTHLRECTCITIPGMWGIHNSPLRHMHAGVRLRLWYMVTSIRMPDVHMWHVHVCEQRKPAGVMLRRSRSIAVNYGFPATALD